MTIEGGNLKPREEKEMREETPKSVQVVNAKELLGERGVVRIDLDGELYTLRMTRNGRLILTK